MLVVNDMHFHLCIPDFKQLLVSPT